MSRQRWTSHVQHRFVSVMIAVVIAIGSTASVSFVRTTVVRATDADTYSWPSAPCAWNGFTTGTCSNYDWGIATCPNGDGYCTSSNQINGYYQLDNFGYGFRNCTSYVAQKISQEFSGRSIAGWGDAKSWWGAATGSGAGHPYASDDGNPQQGDIAVWTGGTFGHVAYVASVDANGVATFDEYNEATTGAFTGTYTSVTHPLVGGASNHAPDHYIHMGIPADPSGTTPTSPGLGGGNASTWSTNRLDAWIAGTNQTGTSNLWHLWFNGTWQPWETIPGSQFMTSQPAAVSWGTNRIDVFARGQTGNLLHEWFDGSWHDWESLGGCLLGAPTVTSWGPLRLDVFIEGCNTTSSNLWHIWYDAAGWHSWEELPGNQLMASSPSAVSWGSGRLDIFSKGQDSSLIHDWFDGAWHDWEPLGGCIVSTPAASTWSTNRLDAWVEGCNTSQPNFYHTFYDAAGWHTFELVPSSQPIYGILGAVSWGANRIDLFTHHADNSLDHWWFTGSWGGPENLGGAIAGW